MRSSWTNKVNAFVLQIPRRHVWLTVTAVLAENIAQKVFAVIMVLVVVLWTARIRLISTISIYARVIWPVKRVSVPRCVLKTRVLLAVLSQRVWLNHAIAWNAMNHMITAWTTTAMDAKLYSSMLQVHMFVRIKISAKMMTHARVNMVSCDALVARCVRCPKSEYAIDFQKQWS